MSKLLVIGDVHTHYEQAEQICKNYPNHKKIFLGDYFDDWNDSVHSNTQTAKWLKQSLQHADRVHLMGNHDFAYFQNSEKNKIFCSGFTWPKFYAIEDVLTQEDWSKVKFFHAENGWWFSHAGVTEYWFSHPVLGLSTESINQIITSNLENMKSGLFPAALYAADAYRGGGSEKGGILWNDWRNLDLIPNVKQVVGHTPWRIIDVNQDDSINACNINVDCSADVYFPYVLEIDQEGNHHILKSDLIN